MLRPDKVVPALQGFVSATLGARFTEPPPFDLAGSYRESSATSPLLFVLSTGSDPTAALLQVWGAVKCGEVCVWGVSESSVSPDRLLYSWMCVRWKCRLVWEMCVWRGNPEGSRASGARGYAACPHPVLLLLLIPPLPFPPPSICSAVCRHHELRIQDLGHLHGAGPGAQGRCAHRHGPQGWLLGAAAGVNV